MGTAPFAPISSRARKIMVGNGGGGSQTENTQNGEPAFSYTDAGCAEDCRARDSGRDDAKSTMVETRIKPYYEQQAEKARARGAAARVPAQPGVRVAAGGGGDLRVVALSYQSQVDFSAGMVAAMSAVAADEGALERALAGTAAMAVSPCCEPAGSHSARPHGQRQDGAFAGAGRAVRRRDCQLRLGGRLSRHGAGHGQTDASKSGRACRII